MAVFHIVEVVNKPDLNFWKISDFNLHFYFNRNFSSLVLEMYSKALDFITFY